MKIGTPEQLKINSIAGDFQSIEAGMDNSSLPFILEMLSKNFYSNPIGSIVREITSNCFDSHIEAGVDDAVVIKIDIDDEGEFILFKDVGMGLSPERIHKVYMKYFTSTKRETNDQIGGFGLGSKTPLAYTDYFYITTISSNIKYSYLFSKGSTLPTLNLLSEEETTERNGTEIKIYIKNNNDRGSFVTQLKSQLCYFDNVYFIGTAIDNDYKIYETDFFKFRNKDQYSDEMHICFGKVSYPIDWDQIGLKPVKVAVGLKFSIEELVVTPNREALRYTDEVKEIVKLRVENTVNLLKEMYLSQQKIHDNIFDWLSQRNKRKYIEFQTDEEFSNDLLYLVGFDDLGKKHTLKILDDLGLSSEILGDDPIKNLFHIIYQLSNHKIKKTYYPDNLTEKLLHSSNQILYSDDSNFSNIKNFYNHNCFIIQETGRNNFIAKKSFIKYLPVPKNLVPKSYNIGEYWKDNYFNLGFALKIYKLTKYIKEQVKARVENYHIEITDDLKKQFVEYQKHNDKTIKRKLEGKVFCTAISSYADYDWALSSTFNITKFGKKVIANVGIEDYKGIVIYGFMEDRKALEKAVTFMYLHPNFREKEKNVCGYNSIKYVDNGYIQSKACRIIRIAKNNEKYFKNKPNMIHVKSLYGDNILFRRMASSYRISIVFEEYLKNYSDIRNSIFIERISKINLEVGQHLKKLHKYYKEFTSEEDARYSQYVRKDLKNEIIQIAEKNNLFDPCVEESLKYIEDWFKGVELLKHVEINDDTLPLILKYLREKKKKLNLEYYCKIIEPWKSSQLEMNFEPETPKTKFELLTEKAA